MLITNLFHIDRKEIIIGFLNESFFGCSLEYWGIMSQVITHLYGEIDNRQIMKILSNINVEGKLIVDHWQSLVWKLESDYHRMAPDLKVGILFL